MAPSKDQMMQPWRQFRVRELPKVAPWVKSLGRFGYYAKAVVYAVVGVLALRLAIGSGGEVTGTRGAIREIGQEPFGRAMLGCLAIGLLGYTVWRVVQAVQDTEGDGTGAKGAIKRAGYVISGIAYLILGCYAGAIALGFNRGVAEGSGGPSRRQQAAGTLLQETWGQALVGIIGAALIATAIAFLYVAYHAKFMEKYPLGTMRPRVRVAALWIGRAGVVTRGVAFAIIGWFLIQAAMSGNSEQVKGLEGALAEIAAQSHSKILLGTAALGLMCYALHSAFIGAYRRFHVG